MITREKTACLVDISVRTLMNRCLYNDSTPISYAWRYKAPEELAEGENYTRATDVYGFAGTVYAVRPSLDLIALVIKLELCCRMEQMITSTSFKPVQRPGMMEVEGQFQEL
jgi:hypothetical protein